MLKVSKGSKGWLLPSGGTERSMSHTLSVISAGQTLRGSQVSSPCKSLVVRHPWGQHINASQGQVQRVWVRHGLIVSRHAHGDESSQSHSIGEDQTWSWYLGSDTAPCSPDVWSNRKGPKPRWEAGAWQLLSWRLVLLQHSSCKSRATEWGVETGQAYWYP